MQKLQWANYDFKNLNPKNLGTVILQFAFVILIWDRGLLASHNFIHLIVVFSNVVKMFDKL